MKLDFDTRKGFGTRASFGVIVLESDETLEPEFATMLSGDGLATYHARIPMVKEVRTDTLARMEQDLPLTAGLLPRAVNFDVIGYGCTSASSVIGSDRVTKAIQTVFPEAKVTNPLLAIIEGARKLGARRLGFMTPYVASVSQVMRDRLEEAGFEIAAFGSFEEGDDSVVAQITPEAIMDGAIKVAETAKGGGLDAMIVSCTNLRALSVIPQIEAATGIPVLSSNQAMAWHMRHLAGVNEANPAFGRLFL